MSTYATFTEHNDWEGETWRFYIPIEGNEDQLDRLDLYLRVHRDVETDDTYSLDLTPVPEVCVDYVVGLGVTGYLPAFTKLSGTLDVDGIEDVEWGGEDDEDFENDPLHKGGIARWVS